MESHLPTDMLKRGHDQWRRKWTVFQKQWTQPQLMKLAELVLGEVCLHSSQIHGFSSGKLKEPGPKVLMVIGHVNLALAAANEDQDAKERSNFSVPQTEPKLWHGKSWIKDSDGRALGPADVFEAFCGILDLGCDDAVGLRPEDMEAVSKSLGKFVRMALISLAQDFMDPDVISSWDRPEFMIKLVYGKVLTVDELDENLDYLCEVIAEDKETVIDLAIKSAIA